MNKKISLMAIILLVAIVLATPLTATVQAEQRTIIKRVHETRKIGTVQYDMWYTETDFFLGDANNTIRIPDNWNGHLIVLCRGYSHTLDPNAFAMDLLSLPFLSTKFAIAGSNYGAEGVCIQKGMIRTHQLTEYMLDKYPVTGKVILVGISMGGTISLLLGEKYPELYNGVLDVCGTKDFILRYKMSQEWLEMSDSELAANLTALGMPIPPLGVPVYPDLNAFRSAISEFNDDVAIECGGTPDEKPKAYERISPLYHPDIRIPILSLAGELDPRVLVSQQYEYRDAVADAGSGTFYRLVVIPGGGHVNTPVLLQLVIYIPKLVTRVLTGTWPPPL